MPAARKPLLFVSSTSDLKEERAAIRPLAGESFDVYYYEKDRARSQAPRDRLVDVLKSTDLFIGLLGGRYGSLYPGCEQDRSIVEWEFDTARSQKHTEVLPFLKKLPDKEIEPDQQRFVDELRHFSQGMWLSEFGSKEELETSVQQSIMQWFSEFWTRHYNRRSGWKDIVVGAAATGTFALVLAATVHIGMLTWPYALAIAAIMVAVALGLKLINDR